MKINLIHHSPHLQKLTEKELDELEQAWTLDKEQEKKFKNKKEKIKCCNLAIASCCFWCCAPREDRQTKLLREIHEAALKQQSTISKQHQVKAEKPFKDSVFSKVRRGNFHDFLRFVRHSSAVLDFMLTRVAKYCSSQYSVFLMRRCSNGPMPCSSTLSSFS